METLYADRRWLVIPTSITSSVNFNQVIEYSTSTLRLSTDDAKTFVKYDITDVTASYTASYVDAITGQTGSYIIEAGIYGRPSIYSPEYPEYRYQEILDVLSTPEWTTPINEL
jgi:hypothetical protein